MPYEWWVKKHILPLFDEGKDLEVRVAEGMFRSVRRGEIAIFNKLIKREIVDIRSYTSFAEMLVHEDHRRIHSGSTATAILQFLKKIYDPQRERRGVLVFELKEIA